MSGSFFGSLDTSALGLGGIEDFIDDPGSYLGSSRFRLIKGQANTFYSSLGEERVKCSFELKSARLSRLTHMRHTTRANKEVMLATGIFSGVSGAFTVTDPDTEEEIPFSKFMHKVATGGNEEIMSYLEFVSHAQEAGFDWEGSSMLLLWQHFAADEDSFDELVQIMISEGASNSTDSIRSDRRERVVNAFSFPTGQGIPIHSMVLRRADRAESRTNQGFLDLFDAQFTNFAKMTRLGREAKAIEAKAGSEELSDEQKEAILSEAKKRRSAAKAWCNNWAGSQENFDYDQTTQTATPTGRWGPVSAPCNEMSIDLHGEIKTISLIGSSDADTTTPAAAAGGTVDASDED